MSPRERAGNGLSFLALSRGRAGREALLGQAAAAVWPTPVPLHAASSLLRSGDRGAPH